MIAKIFPGFKAEWFLYLLLFMVVLCWGFNWPITKIGLNYLPPLWFAATRLIIGSIALFFILLATKKFAFPKKQDWPMIAGIGIFQIFLFMIFVNIGLQYVPAGRGAMLAYTTPLWTAPIAAIFFKEKISRLQIISIFMGLLGIIVMFNPLHMDWSNHNMLIGDGFMILCAWSWSIAMLFARFGKWHSPPLTLMFWKLLLSAIPLVILASIFQPLGQLTWSAPLIMTNLYNGLIGGAFCYWGSVVATRGLPVQITSLSLIGVPIISLIISIAFLGERLTLYLAVAIALVLGGIASMVWSSRKKLAKNKTANVLATD